MLLRGDRSRGGFLLGEILTSTVSLAKELISEHTNPHKVDGLRHDEKSVMIFNDKVKEQHGLQEKKAIE